MKINRLFLAVMMLCGVATVAQARRNPTPKPSGIVIHLFGPRSVASQLTAATPEAATGSAAALADPSAEPTMGAVLHQMFVTGDPNAPTMASTGRAADHPPAD